MICEKVGCIRIKFFHIIVISLIAAVAVLFKIVLKFHVSKIERVFSVNGIVEGPAIKCDFMILLVAI